MRIRKILRVPLLESATLKWRAMLPFSDILRIPRSCFKIIAYETERLVWYPEATRTRHFAKATRGYIKNRAGPRNINFKTLELIILRTSEVPRVPNIVVRVRELEIELFIDGNVFLFRSEALTLTRQ